MNIVNIDPQLKKILKVDKMNHIGIVVRDLEKAMKNYIDFFGMDFHRVVTPEYFNRIYRGKPGNFRIRIAIGDVDQVEIELIQVLEGETIYGEFLEKRGEGLHHLGSLVKNMDERIEAIKKLGIDVLQSGERVGAKWAYVDTEKIIGIIYELVQRE